MHSEGGLPNAHLATLPQMGETAASLLRKSFMATHPRVRERFMALALIAEGHTAKAVARRLGRHRGMVEAWVHRFNTHGVAGVWPHFRGHPGRMLSPEQLAELKAVVQRPPRHVGLKVGTWSGTAVVAYVKRTFGKTISAATARRYLHQLGLRRKRPRKRRVKANRKAQIAFAQGLQQVEQQREPGGVTVYLDQGQIWQDALPRLGWFLRGQSAEVDSISPGKPAKILFYVAVVRPLGRVITMLCSWFDQMTTARFLAKLRRCLPGVRIDLVLDNAPHHHGAMVEAALVHYRIVAHWLPPYSPEMNAAESWIGWAKAVLSANTCWQEHGTLVRSFIGFEASMIKRPLEVLRRCVPDMLGFRCA
jgi:transposase